LKPSKKPPNIYSKPIEAVLRESLIGTVPLTSKGTNPIRRFIIEEQREALKAYKKGCS